MYYLLESLIRIRVPFFSYILGHPNEIMFQTKQYRLQFIKFKDRIAHSSRFICNELVFIFIADFQRKLRARVAKLCHICVLLCDFLLANIAARIQNCVSSFLWENQNNIFKEFLVLVEQKIVPDGDVAVSGMTRDVVKKIVKYVLVINMQITKCQVKILFELL